MMGHRHKTWSDARTALTLLSAAVFLVTAYSSNGYFYPDEHFQLIEFARWKTGACTSETVPWELAAHIRPTLQPIITIILLKAMELCGASDPFVLALSLRVVMAAAVMWSVCHFIRCTQSSIMPGHINAYTALSFLLWFIPYISVRYSSETMSAVFLLLAAGMACRMAESPGEVSAKRAAVMGILLGVAFEFRYQTMFAVLGLLCWYVCVYRRAYTRIAIAAAGFLSVIAMALLADSWFYGRPVFPPLDYFRENIINGVAATFGVSPWYEYVLMLLGRPTHFIGTCMLLSLLCSCVRHFRSPVVWIVVFFIAGHSMADHKELRFLFPMAFFFPIMLIWTWELIYTPRLKALFAVLAAAFVLTDAGGLLMLAAKPAKNGRGNALKYVYDNRETRRVICTHENNIYRVSSLDLEFYRRKGITVDEDLDLYLLGSISPKRGDAVIITQGDIWRRQMAENAGLKLVYRSVPQWVGKLNLFYKTFNGDDTLLVYARE